jgi:tRNA threonylcarbamoyladenosine biosynthesis protein TsaE
MISSRFQTTTRTVAETRELGKTIGKRIEHPLIIGISGELGSGKTVFVQGLAEGLEVPSEYYITSPTFTLINEYPGRLPLCHIDLYRLDGIHELEDIGLDELLYQKAVIAIEWAEKMSHYLPDEHLTMTFEIAGDNDRKIGLNAFGRSVVNLIELIDNNIKVMK